MVAPPDAKAGSMDRVVVAWNGSAQAARAVGYSLPFLIKATQVTVLVADADSGEAGTSLLMRNLGRHGHRRHGRCARSSGR